MTPGYAAFISILVIAQIALPKRFAMLPLVVGACHLGNVEIVAELTASRVLIAVGLIRALATGSFKFSFSNRLDLTLLLFSVVAILSSFGHPKSTFNPWIARAGLVYNVLGVYLYGRAYISNLSEFRVFAQMLPIVLIPLAICLSLEKGARRNLYAYLGSNSLIPMIRDDKIRAQGPFRHAILAGCSGATTLPLAFLLWYRRRKALAIIGGTACFVVVIACASSGPLAAVAVGLAALLLWRWREKMGSLVWLGLAFAAFYWIVAGRGPWYIMASIDLVGGSTGWHRAKLFDQGFKYLGEWWIAGTDYTRHWMATGVSWSNDHVDLTNYYLHLGVIGGIGLPVLLVYAICWSLRHLFVGMRVLRDAKDANEVILWCAGAALCTHAVSFVSISYFDQMYVLFYLILASIPALLSYVDGVLRGVNEPRLDPVNADKTYA